MANSSKVLLTGVTGFLGSHTTIQLLNKGYTVTGTLRNLKRADEIKAVIAKHTVHIGNLHFAEADLKDANAWDSLMEGIDFVQHIASPFPRVLPKDENDLIQPAKNGTLTILKAAAKHGVKRVVLTSSTGAIVYGREKAQRSGTYTEKDWTNEANKKDSTPYFRSKTIAEKAAWDFIQQDQSELELTTICPGAILGPILEKDFGTSANIVIKSMDGSSPALPKLGFPMVDVRSVAELHILAMESPKAAGERFAATAGYHSFKEVADILKAQYPNHKIPSTILPNFAVRIFAKIDPTLGPILIDLGVERRVDNAKAKALLDWQPISTKEAILACAKSAFEQGILK